jgi:hypothetical protein
VRIGLLSNWSSQASNKLFDFSIFAVSDELITALSDLCSVRAVFVSQNVAEKDTHREGYKRFAKLRATTNHSLIR